MVSSTCSTSLDTLITVPIRTEPLQKLDLSNIVNVESRYGTNGHFVVVLCRFVDDEGDGDGVCMRALITRANVVKDLLCVNALTLEVLLKSRLI